jgi:hypothetical protein
MLCLEYKDHIESETAMDDWRLLHSVRVFCMAKCFQCRPIAFLLHLNFLTCEGQNCQEQESLRDTEDY